jgi:transposase
MGTKVSTEATLRDIKRKTRKKYSAEEKIRIVLEGLRGEVSVAELCRREGINQNLYYKWSKDFLEAGKSRLQGDTQRQANGQEVADIRRENDELKQMVAELALRNRALKKTLHGAESEWASRRRAKPSR